MARAAAVVAAAIAAAAITAAVAAAMSATMTAAAMVADRKAGRARPARRRAILTTKFRSDAVPGLRSGLDAQLGDRLIRYAAVDTQSDGASDTVPSTQRQLTLSRMLVEELVALGVTNARLTDYGAVLALLPATRDGAPTIGFCAHVDTAPQFHATGVKPRLHSGWDGTPIRFPDAPDLILSPADRPYLAEKMGTTSSRPPGPRCWAPMTRPVWPSS